MSPPHLCWPKRYAMSPPDPSFPTNVCKVATWPYLKIVETGPGFIYLWSINFWMSSWKKTDTNNTMDFFLNYHKVKHTCICNVAMDHPQVQTYMQCRPLNLALQKVYARSPLFFFLMEGGMQCRHVTPVISIHHNQIPLRCHRNLRNVMDCLIFCMQCRHAIPLANQNRVCSVAMWMAQQVICSVAMRPGLPTVHSMQCRPHPFTVMHICNVAA